MRMEGQRRAPPSRGAAEKGQGFFTVQNHGLVKSTCLPPGRQLRRNQVCGLTGGRSYPGRSQVSPPSEVGASAPPVLDLETRAGGLGRPNTSEVIIEAFHRPLRGKRMTPQPLRVQTEPPHAARFDGAEATLVKNEGVRCPPAARTVRRAKESDEKR